MCSLWGSSVLCSQYTIQMSCKISNKHGKTAPQQKWAQCAQGKQFIYVHFTCYTLLTVPNVKWTWMKRQGFSGHDLIQAIESTCYLDGSRKRVWVNGVQPSMTFNHISGLRSTDKTPPERLENSSHCQWWDSAHKHWMYFNFAAIVYTVSNSLRNTFRPVTGP